MDWFKHNPFLASLATAGAVLFLGGGFLIFSQMGRLAEEQSAFEQAKTKLLQMQRNKPFPSQANVEETKRETGETRSVLDEMAKGFAVQSPSASPQTFQDELSKLVKDIGEKAAAKNIALPENFYLGFEKYEKQLPAAEAAPRLTMQLRTIHAVASVLVDAQVKSLGPILRADIRGEVPTAEGGESKEADKNDKTAAADFEMAPFDIAFNADQTAFRLSFNRILELQPPVFVRLVGLENSNPAPPPKVSAASADGQAVESPAKPPADAAGIKPVVGRETINVNLRLASILSSLTSSP
ncbi:MAG: hypothetical protein JHD33_03575 [Chthoniobacterales bacterium]|nr:hypothetical protein [Chthoniobacterales bacterium]